LEKKKTAHQAPLSMGFPRQEYWSRLPFPLPEDLPYPGINLLSPALAGRFFTIQPPWKTIYTYKKLAGEEYISLFSFFPMSHFSWKLTLKSSVY